MRLKYMFHRKRKEVHPFHVKSNWNPPVQKSVALESFLEEVKMDLADIKIIKPNRTCHAMNEKHFKMNSNKKPAVWKRYIDDIFSLWDASKTDIERFIEQANSHHPTVKFTAEISNTDFWIQSYTKAKDSGNNQSLT